MLFPRYSEIGVNAGIRVISEVWLGVDASPSPSVAASADAAAARATAPSSVRQSRSNRPRHSWDEYSKTCCRDEFTSDGMSVSSVISV